MSTSSKDFVDITQEDVDMLEEDVDLLEEGVDMLEEDVDMLEEDVDMLEEDVAKTEYVDPFTCHDNNAVIVIKYFGVIVLTSVWVSSDVVHTYICDWPTGLLETDMWIRRKIPRLMLISGCITCVLVFFVTRTVLVKRSVPVTRPVLVTRNVAVRVRKQIPFITLFTTWSTYPEAFLVYNNTLRNWPLLQPYVNIILFTNDTIPDEHKRLGWTVLPVKRQINGHPVLKHLFLEAMKLQPNSKLYGFANGDILFTESFINSLLEIVGSSLLVDKTYMVVGRRMNTPNVTHEEASSWETIKGAAKRGKLMNIMWGIDYFLTSPGYHWKDIPEVQIGQNYYDNWLVWDARRMGYDTIDVTITLLAVHQNAPYPKKHGQMENNLKYFNESRRTIGTKGVIPCCNLYTQHRDGKLSLQRRKKIPKHCKMEN